MKIISSIMARTGLAVINATNFFMQAALVLTLRLPSLISFTADGCVHSTLYIPCYL